MKVYAVGPDVKAPEFIPTNLPPIAAEKCKKKMDGKVELSLLVDATGGTRNIMFIHPLGNDLDKLALKTVAADRLTPATSNGLPVVVAEKVNVNLQACVEQIKGSAGKKATFLRLLSQPMRDYQSQSQPHDDAILVSGDSSWDESKSGSVPTSLRGTTKTPPVVLVNPQPESAELALKAGVRGSCSLSMIVDSQGMPQDVQVVRSLGHWVEQKAVEVAQRYRFSPAMRDGGPVPLRISFEIILGNY